MGGTVGEGGIPALGNEAGWRGLSANAAISTLQKFQCHGRWQSGSRAFWRQPMVCAQPRNTTLQHPSPECACFHPHGNRPIPAPIPKRPKVTTTLLYALACC